MLPGNRLIPHSLKYISYLMANINLFLMKKDILTEQLSVVPIENSNVKIKVPQKLISLKKGLDYVNHFRDSRLVESEEQTQEVWFELDRLRMYLDSLEKVTRAKNLQISRLSFILGADANNKRTVFLAPMRFDDKYGIHRAFSLDNNEITHIYRFPIEDYSAEDKPAQLTSIDQSLLLGPTGYISGAEAIGM